MQKQNENLFSEKFKLLNSQENTEKILWTCSESSESDDASNCERLANLTNKTRKRKRKPKKRVPKNIANLDVTIVDVPKSVSENNTIVKFSKSLQQCHSRIEKPSPTFESAFPPYKHSKHEGSSPILFSKACDLQKRRCLPDQSPILMPKYASPKNSSKIRKILFQNGENSASNIKTHKESIESKNKSCSPILLTKKDSVQELQRWKSENLATNSFKISTTHPNSIHINHSNYHQDTISRLVENNQNIDKENTSVVIMETPTYESSKSDECNLDDSLVMLKTNNHELVKRVKSYFDSHFSSETTSQCSISESLTPKQSTKTSDEIEILNITTQINSVINSSSSVDEKNRSPSLESSHNGEIDENSKKIRYKKDGLAYHLNALLKKRMANFSLWQHEKFMAENSNFVIPKGEHIVFRIQKVDFKYGCYLIQAVDLSEDIFLIFINNKYVQNCIIMPDMIFKLYKPYKSINFKDECKLIINVCKFECLNFKP
ncbi:uncharacterized protein LOC113229183 [Hyposmocoma kahamanoa]|uniref:uncharacterized protein LOC113229183 n=1 Tax=Hyposmocoma kahamanoa TaxID=1477025 RepID=UPI000E6D8232|nr:uncharacterized protein LOC113229183 [Hyposmocoma kahamanoa]